MSLQTREGANSEKGKKQAISAYCTLLEHKLEDDTHFREDSSKFCHNSPSLLSPSVVQLVLV